MDFGRTVLNPHPQMEGFSSTLKSPLDGLHLGFYGMLTWATINRPTKGLRARS
jgi:hypothetical protein